MQMTLDIQEAAQVQALYDTLTEEQKTALGIREDYNVELRIKLGRGSAIGSVIMSAECKFETENGWIAVASTPEQVEDLPIDLILHLAGAALMHPIAQELLVAYFGEMPSIVAPQ